MPEGDLRRVKSFLPHSTIKSRLLNVRTIFVNNIIIFFIHISFIVRQFHIKRFAHSRLGQPILNGARYFHCEYAETLHLIFKVISFQFHRGY